MFRKSTILVILCSLNSFISLSPAMAATLSQVRRQLNQTQVSCAAGACYFPAGVVYSAKSGLTPGIRSRSQSYELMSCVGTMLGRKYVMIHPECVDSTLQSRGANCRGKVTFTYSTRAGHIQRLQCNTVNGVVSRSARAARGFEKSYLILELAAEFEHEGAVVSRIESRQGAGKLIYARNSCANKEQFGACAEHATLDAISNISSEYNTSMVPFTPDEYRAHFSVRASELPVQHISMPYFLENRNFIGITNSKAIETQVSHELDRIASWLTNRMIVTDFACMDFNNGTDFVLANAASANLPGCTKVVTSNELAQRRAQWFAQPDHTQSR